MTPPAPGCGELDSIQRRGDDDGRVSQVGHSVTSADFQRVLGPCYPRTVTILEVINKTTPYFEKQGIESPRLTIELLLAHLLKKKRMQLYLEFERDLDEATLEVLRGMVKRRVAGEPLQYITGETEFCGLKFMVDKRVLIPRPETELLVEKVVERQTAGDRSQETEDRRQESEGGERKTVYKIVDVGTGSGCIAIALAKKVPRAEITAIDVSTEALEVAGGNARLHEVEKNIRFLESDLLENVPSNFVADVVVSNPPYIADGEIAKLPKEVRGFEPVRALAAGEDGLKVIRRLVMNARRFLSPTGFMALEIGAGQRPAVEEIFGQQGWDVVEIVKDLQGHERVIVAQPKK
jgi:release factor glutamine methyltransferase